MKEAVSPIKIKESKKELFVIIILTLWALLGNTLYNGTYGDQINFFNWLFVVQDPFYILPRNIAPFVMPFIVIIAFVSLIWDFLPAYITERYTTDFTEKDGAANRFDIWNSCMTTFFNSSFMRQLFGYGASDSNPYNNAKTFSTYAEGIDLLARVFVKYYLK